MPWVEETLRHDNFLDDLFDKVFRRFKDKSGNRWWQDFNGSTPKVDMYKITFEQGVLVKDETGYKVPSTAQQGIIAVTRHMIFRRWDNELVAFAQSTGAVRVSTEDMPTNKTDLMRWFVEFYRTLVDYTTVYSYTMDKYEGYTHFVSSDGKVAPVTIIGDDGGYGVLRSSLDIEYYDEETYYPDTKQSPIITLKLREETGETVAAIGKLNYRMNTNWWEDSLIQLRGVFDETSAFFTLKVDSAPMWEDNKVTLVPYFFGNLVNKTATKRNETPIAILGGTQVGKFFDFDNIELKTDTLQPVTRNYVNHPSNGIDSVMVKKTKYGARYQEHFLRWNAPPNVMPPTREELRLVKDAMGTEQEEEAARKYPRAYNYLRFGYYNYQFHPSRYSEKLLTSRAIVMHPEDGVIGHIPNIVLFPLINIMEGDRLKYPYWCSECSEEPYNPGTPTESTKHEWEPLPPTTGGGNTDNPGGNPDGGSSGDSGGGSGEDPGEEPGKEENNHIRFIYHCDESVAASSIDDAYWEDNEVLQKHMNDDIGRSLNLNFWTGRNDWLEYISHLTERDVKKSIAPVADFHKFLWKSISEVISGAETVPENWLEFKAWSDETLGCLTDLQTASLFMSTKLKKPVTFFEGTEAFLEGDILDKMLPYILKVPHQVYDWIDFNDVTPDNPGSIVGAFTMDSTLITRNADGTIAHNYASNFKSYVNFEPQLLNYKISAANGHRPFDYLKPTVGFGKAVTGGEYTNYYVPEMTDENFKAYVAAESAIHEMAHAVSFYALDVIGTKLDAMDEWLNISGWVRKSDGTFDQLIKSNPGTTLDNGKLAPVSDYGCFSPAEDFAEAFMVYAVNPQFLRDKFKEKYDFIETKLKEIGLTVS